MQGGASVTATGLVPECTAVGVAILASFEVLGCLLGCIVFFMPLNRKSNHN